jgi:prepilin-type N-terminal cleavage/methylation domain-containing protein
MGQPASQEFDMKRAFTLVEMLVVVGVIAILVSILLPAALNSKRRAEATAGTANLRSLSQVMSMYTTDSGDAFLNPFGLGARPSVAHSMTNPELSWNFEAPMCPPCSSEGFAYYWYSYLADYDDTTRVREEQFSPADGWMKSLRKSLAARPETRDRSMLWPTSFLYSPTFWSDSSRFPGSRLAADGTNIKTQYLQMVAYASSKVMLFERADFEQSDRVTVDDGTSSRVGRPPAWNNIRSNTAAATVDGAVREVEMADLYAASGLPTPLDQIVGWDRPGLVAPERDSDLPTGAVGGSDGNYPGFFWSTPRGIEGRDLPL